MLETPNTPEQSSNPGAQIEWRRKSREEIESMSETELRDYLYGQDIKVQRLYSVFSTMAANQRAGIETKAQDIEDLLRRERFEEP